MIDGGNLEWPEEVTAALPEFRQGTLVPHPPFAYHANTNLPLWEASALSEEKAADTSVQLADEDRPAYGVITSQSCDVDEEGLNRKPWVQLAPVYELPENHQNLNLIREWHVGYMLPIPALGPQWVGDLRIEIPVEKSWLVGQNHVDAYHNQPDFDRMADHVAAYRGRPAMATSVHEIVLEPLSAFLTTLHRDSPDLYLQFHQHATDVFVELAGDALNPNAVAVIFVGDGAWPDAVREVLDDWWENNLAPIEAPFVVTALRYRLSNDITLAELRGWIAQDLARLGGS